MTETPRQLSEHVDHHAGRSLQFQQLGVSNSEVGSASTCMRQWWYAHHPQTHLAPKTFGPALTRGIIGHKALELFYLGIKSGEAYDTAAHEALAYVFKASTDAMLANDVDKLDILVQLKKLLEMYFEHYKADMEYWEILEVEGFHLLEWPGEHDVYLPMRLDVTIYMKDGQFKGETMPLDHKFTNDFWHPWKFQLNSQFPLYMRALRSARFAGKSTPVVRRTIVNMIRTRKVDKPVPAQTFKRAFVEADETIMENVFQNHLKVAKRVALLKRMPAGEAFQHTEAVWGSANCQFCSFREVCATQLRGGNVDAAVAASYTNSDYGYPSMQELKAER